MSPRARPRARSAPPAQRHAAVPAPSAPTARAITSIYTNEQLHSLKSLERTAGQLEESSARTAKRFHAFMLSLQEMSNRLCAVVAQATAAMPAGPAEQTVLKSVTLSLEPSRRLLERCAEVALWEAQMEKVTAGAKQLSAAAKVARASEKTTQSAIRRVRKAESKRSQPSSLEQSVTTESKTMRSLQSAQRTGTIARDQLRQLMTVALPEMVYGYTTVVAIVGERLLRTFGSQGRRENSTQTPPLPAHTSRSTQCSARTAPRRDAPSVVPPSISSPHARPRSSSMSAPRVALAPTTSAQAESSSVLQHISQVFGSLFDNFTRPTAPPHGAEAVPHSEPTQDRTSPLATRPSPATGRAGTGVVRGVVLSSTDARAAGASALVTPPVVPHTDTASQFWLLEGLPPPQYPEYLFSSGDLFSTVPQHPAPHVRREW